MDSFAHVLAAYLDLTTRPGVTAAELAAFWDNLEALLPLDAVEYMRREVEQHLCEPDPPADAGRADPELLALWAGVDVAKR